MEDFTGYLCFEMGVAARKLHKYYNNRFSEYGITLTQSFILFALLLQDGQNVKNLAERLSLESPAVTGLVDRLEKENMVQRRSDPGDRRALKVFLTEKGRLLADKLIPVANEFNKKLKSQFSPEQVNSLKKLLMVINEEM
ncbi:transcriptional regulator [Desulfocucumis palustris]|uniref:Transcriptional regulator n=1 Tax=Desulfocucumis palustris TaxID=1898651 RepID=A0A2L2XE83_9FIRM|nr:MarR family transcriptional regulator [Desulfocucumis palustris]GBF34023.1 transcriptional regulator [Desulfocucumis palustris]